MILTTLLGTVASAVIGSFGGPGKIITDVVNGFVGDDDKVGSDSTIEEVQAKIDKLPPEQQAVVASAYYAYLGKVDDNKTAVTLNVEDERTNRLRIMEETDRNIMVRPKIAERMAWLIIVVTLLLAASMAYDTVKNGTTPDPTEILALLSLPTWCVKVYFDRRSADKTVKAKVMSGETIGEIGGGIASGLISKALKR